MKERKQKKKLNTIECNQGVSLQEMQYLADKEEEALKQDVQDLKSWTNMMDSMNEEKLKDYIENRPVELKTVKIEKSNNPPRPKIQRIGKFKASNNGIMASVMKFHKDHDDEE